MSRRLVLSWADTAWMAAACLAIAVLAALAPPARAGDDPPSGAAAARWQAGYVRLDGHLQLAAWCADRGLDQQAKAHLLRVVSFDPNHAIARARLGHKRVGGVWLTAEELRAGQQRQQKLREGLARWRPKVEAADRIDSHEASRSLARGAVFAPSEAVRRAAAEALRGPGEGAGVRSM